MDRNAGKGTGESPRAYPPWYWVRGLHDAEILGLREIPPLRGSQAPCLEIALDASGALLDTEITRLTLFSFRWNSAPAPLTEPPRLWWLRDRLTAIPDGRYRLEVVLQNARRRHVFWDVSFEEAALERLEA